MSEALDVIEEENNYHIENIDAGIKAAEDQLEKLNAAIEANKMLLNLLNGTTENISWVSDGISKLLHHSMSINSCVYGDIQNYDIKMSNLNAIIFHTSFDAVHTKLYIDTIYKFIWTNRRRTDEEDLEFNTHYSFLWMNMQILVKRVSQDTLLQ